jgi:hypothetical protein
MDGPRTGWFGWLNAPFEPCEGDCDSDYDCKSYVAKAPFPYPKKKQLARAKCY